MSKITTVMEVECIEENGFIKIKDPITKNKLMEFCKSKELNITDINLPNMKDIEQLGVY